jgi:hypothetical protein
MAGQSGVRLNISNAREAIRTILRRANSVARSNSFGKAIRQSESQAALVARSYAEMLAAVLGRSNSQ